MGIRSKDSSDGSEGSEGKEGGKDTLYEFLPQEHPLMTCKNEALVKNASEIGYLSYAPKSNPCDIFSF